MVTALGAVAKGITDLGQPDPRKQADGTFWPVLTDFKRAMARDDEPKDRAYPVNTTILRQLDTTLDCDDAEWGVYNQVIRDLIIVGFFWLLEALMERVKGPDFPTKALIVGRQGMPLGEPAPRDTMDRQFEVKSSVPFEDVRVVVNPARVLSRV